MNLAYNTFEILELSELMTSKIKVTLGKNDFVGFANSVITKIWIYNSLHVFEGKESVFDIK